MSYARIAVLGICVLSACDKTDRPFPSGETDPDMASSGAMDPEPPPPPEPDDDPPPADGGSTDDDGGEPPATFIQEYDNGGTSVECDVFAQDCPAGTKCMPWANDGGSAWNATRCTELAAKPAAPGEPCTVVGNGVSGIDTCEISAMCWNVDPETNEGTCVGMCIGSDYEPYCEDPDSYCAISCDGVLTLCLSHCDPIAQDCPMGQACYPMGSGYFSCAPDASGDSGAQGDPCEFINVCDPGLACLSADAVGCDEAAFGCCSSYCTLGGEPCPDALECVPYFNAGQAPPGLDDVGLCLLGA